MMASASLDISWHHLDLDECDLDDLVKTDLAEFNLYDLLAELTGVAG